MQTPQEKLEAFCESLSTEMLADAALALDGQAGIEQGIARRQMFATLEARHPEVEALMEKWFADESPEGQMRLNTKTYAQILNEALVESKAVLA